MEKRSIYGIFILSFLAIPVLLAGCRSHSIEERAVHLTRYVAGELEMTDAQSARLQGSIAKLLEKEKDLREIRDSVTGELVAQLRTDQVDSEHLNEVIMQNKAKMESMLALLVDEFTELHKDLTPEQRAEVASRIEKIQERFFERHRWWG